MNLDKWPLGLADGDLLAYIEGAADDVTRQRVDRLLAENPELRGELADLARLHETLITRLGESQVISSQELGEYALGLLPPRRAADLERRLSSDLQAQRDLAELQAFLSSPDLSPALEPVPGGSDSVSRRISVIFAQLVQGLSDLTTAFEAPALAPVTVRGDAPGSVSYEIGTGRLIIVVQPDTTRPELRSVLGLLIDVQQPESLTTLLYEGDRLVAEAACDELGNFVLTDLSPQTYELVLHGATLEVIVPDLVVK